MASVVLAYHCAYHSGQNTRLKFIRIERGKIWKHEIFLQTETLWTAATSDYDSSILSFHKFHKKWAHNKIHVNGVFWVSAYLLDNKINSFIFSPCCCCIFQCRFRHSQSPLFNEMRFINVYLCILHFISGFSFVRFAWEKRLVAKDLSTVFSRSKQVRSQYVLLMQG